MKTSSFTWVLFIHNRLSVGSIKQLSVKISGGMEAQLCVFLNFSLHGSVMLHNLQLYSQRKSSRYQLTRWEEEFSTLPEFNTYPVALGYSSLYWLSYPDDTFSYAINITKQVPSGHLAFTFYWSRRHKLVWNESNSEYCDDYANSTD
jgi:hypothetical protein